MSLETTPSRKYRWAKVFNRVDNLVTILAATVSVATAIINAHN